MTSWVRATRVRPAWAQSSVAMAVKSFVNGASNDGRRERPAMRPAGIAAVTNYNHHRSSQFKIHEQPRPLGRSLDSGQQ
jgi:hypothetical protein